MRDGRRSRPGVGLALSTASISHPALSLHCSLTHSISHPCLSRDASTTEIIDGKATAATIRQELKAEVDGLMAKYNRGAGSGGRVGG